MDVERLVVRLMADAMPYNRIMDATAARMASFATMAATTLGKTAMELASNYERAGIAFEVMTGQAEVGQKMLRDVAKLALETPFSADELIKSAKQVKAFGFETDDVIPILSRLGDVASATGSDMDRIILAFGQVRTTGRLMGQELRQFTNAGVPILENLAKVLGVSVAQVPNLVRQGKISFSDVAAAFNNMTNAGGIFHDMMGRINKETLSGRWQNFKENLAASARNLGLAAIEGLNLKETLTFLAGGSKVDMDRAKSFFHDLRKGLQATGFALSKFWAGLVEVWKQIKEVAGQVGGWADRNKELVRTLVAAFLIVKTITTAAWLLNAAWLGIAATFALLISPIGLATLAIAGVIAVLNELGAFAGTGNILASGFGKMAEMFGTAWAGIKDAIKGDDLQLAWDIALTGLSGAWKALLITMEAAWERFSGNIVKKLSLTGDFGHGLSIGMLNTASFMAKQMAGVFGSKEDVEKVEQQRQAAVDSVLKMNDEFNAQQEAQIQGNVNRVMAGLNAIPELKQLREMRELAELTRFVGKSGAGMMGVMRAAAFEPRRGAGFQVTAGSIGDLRPDLPDMGDVFGGNRMAAAVTGVYFDSLNKQMFTDAVTAVGRVNHMLHERRIGLVPWTDADIADAGQKARDAEKKFKDFRDAITGKKTTSDHVPDIMTPRQVGAEVLTFARDLSKEFNKGVGPLEEYTHAMHKLNEAFQGPLAQMGLPGRGIGAALNVMSMFGAPNTGMSELFRGIIKPEENEFGMFRNFEALQKGVGTDPLRLGGAGAAMQMGSREAQETINRSNAQLISFEEQVLRTMLDANTMHRAAEAHRAQVVAALRAIAEKPGLAAAGLIGN